MPHLRYAINNMYSCISNNNLGIRLFVQRYNRYLRATTLFGNAAFVRQIIKTKTLSATSC